MSFEHVVWYYAVMTSMVLIAQAVGTWKAWQIGRLLHKSAFAWLVILAEGLGVIGILVTLPIFLTMTAESLGPYSDTGYLLLALRTPIAAWSLTGALMLLHGYLRD